MGYTTDLNWAQIDSASKLKPKMSCQSTAVSRELMPAKLAWDQL